MTPPIWCLMPVLGAREYTEAAITDLLAQSVPTRILVINQGVDTSFREHLEQIAEQNDERVFVWHHDPCLPSLSASWNAGLTFAWATGGEVALVVNNDARFHHQTVDILTRLRKRYDAYFLTAVGVREHQFDPTVQYLGYVGNEREGTVVGAIPTADDFSEGTDHSFDTSRGGPDFSCFLISKEGHERYPFDEHFIPAYCEDLDTHRRYMLGGDGDKIFSVNLPYLHYASGTLKSMDPEPRAQLEARINSSRAYYARKWGGPVNGERFTLPFDAETDQDGVTTPDLQHRLLGTEPQPAPSDGVLHPQRGASGLTLVGDDSTYEEA